MKAVYPSIDRNWRKRMKISKTSRIIMLLLVGGLAAGFSYWYLNKKEHSLEFMSGMYAAGSFDTANLKSFSDLRGYRLTPRKIRKADFRDKLDVLYTCDFDTKTPWDKLKIPGTFNPGKVMEWAKNPGLGIRDLHREGITGKGVKVAAIDFYLLKGHEEYKDKIALYTTVGGVAKNDPNKGSMHGTLVASLLVGERCGVAPGASLYFYADYEPKRDYSAKINGLEHVMRYNEGRPLSDRIRVVTITQGFVDTLKRLKEFKKTVKKALNSGITVVYVTRTLGGVGCPPFKDRDKPGNYMIANMFKDFPEEIPDNAIYVRSQFITGAGPMGVKDYYYLGDGGLSSAVPYLAGVITLGYQVNPNLKTDEIFQYIRETGTPFNRGWLINPGAFINRVKKSRS